VFSDDEMQLLNKRLKYNLHHKPKRWLQTLSIKPDTAVDVLPEKNSELYGEIVAGSIRKIIKKKSPKNKNAKNPLQT
jgi:hypothetical protein